MPQGARFDLRSSNEQRERDKRFLLTSCVVIGAVFAATSVGRLLEDGPAIIAGHLSLVLLALDSATWVGTGLILWFLGSTALEMRPGAEFIRVSDAGFEVGFPGGRGYARGWTDPSVEILLYEWPRNPQLGYVLKCRGIRSSIPSEAYELILRHSERHRMRATVSTEWVWLPALRPRVTTLRAGQMGAGDDRIG
jgi:hypothetical protein